jgi:alanine-synthesizing transaminase
LVQGSAFNLDDTQHLRIVFLPDKAQLVESLTRLATFLDSIRK